MANNENGADYKETPIEKQLRITVDRLSEQTEQVQYELAAQTRDVKRLLDNQTKKFAMSLEDEVISRLDALYNQVHKMESVQNEILALLKQEKPAKTAKAEPKAEKPAKEPAKKETKAKK